MARLLPALALGGLLLAATPTALAAAPAAEMHDRQCTPLGGGVTSCSSIKLVEHSADQPDGDQSFVYHYELREEMTGPTGVLFASTIADDIHFVTVEGLMQELHLRSRYSADVPGFTCRWETYYHSAEGQVQIDRTEYEC